MSYTHTTKISNCDFVAFHENFHILLYNWGTFWVSYEILMELEKISTYFWYCPKIGQNNLLNSTLWWKFAMSFQWALVVFSQSFSASGNIMLYVIFSYGSFVWITKRINLLQQFHSSCSINFVMDIYPSESVFVFR